MDKKQKLKKFIETTICLAEQNVNGKETLEEFYNRFEIENSNPLFLKNHFKNPNFRLELTHDGDVKIRKYVRSIPNKCETNVFYFIKDMGKLNNHRYYPVSGWAFTESTTYFEHFWIYDGVEDLFLDITPMTNGLPYAYGGVINYDINDEIMNAENFDDIDFLKGKAGRSLYHKYMDNDTRPEIRNPKKSQTIFDYIKTNEKYKDLSDFINDNNISDVEELKSYLYKLESKRDTVRNNRDWDYYSSLIDQIKYLEI